MSGDFELIDIKTGQRLTIAQDGSELRDVIDPPALEYCDKCQLQKIKMDGDAETVASAYFGR
jgi:hypothetical protein